jgi:Tfp pilus assembly protein PilN
MRVDLIPMSPGTPADAVLRTPGVVADLLPTEIIESRRARRMRWSVLTALLLTACLIGAVQTVAAQRTAGARNRLEGVQTEVTRLQGQQSAFAELIRTKNSSSQIEGQLAALLANDLPWWEVLGSLRAAAPSGVSVTGVTGSLAGATGALGSAGSSAAQGEELPKASGERMIGSLTITGMARDNRAVAAYVDALQGVHALSDPLLTGMTRDKGDLQYTVAVDITDKALGGRFTAPAGGGSGGN